MKWFGLLIALSGLVLSGCSATPKHSGYHASQTSTDAKVNLRNTSQVKNLLLSQYRSWKGTPYQYGGTTKRGIDCSAFVQNTYRNQFNIPLSRTTRTQVKEGKKVTKSALKTGDIVFFRTGRNTRHNGIYLGKNKFIHASSSKGVTISDLTRPYWKKHYWTSRRL